jgi:hypothetical protein
MRRPQFTLKTLLWLMMTVAFSSVWAGYVYRAGVNRTVVVPVPVSGILTVNGKQIPGWEVAFLYAGVDRAATTVKVVTGADGSFTLPGVWPGEYRVGFLPACEYEFVGLAQANPARWYPNPETSRVKAVVESEGQNNFHFDLTQPK